MSMTFRKAVKSEAYLRMALAGPSGSGKTFSALTIASALAGDKSVAVLDTERGSASKYADLFTFDVIDLDAPFHPDRFVEAIRAAESGGYGVLVIDSLSHAWNGSGGLLELVEQIAKRSKSGNTYTAWAEATPIQNRLIDAITRARLHILITMRSKQEYVLDKDERTGKTTPRKVGMAPIQRDGMEYEVDVFGELDQDNTLIIQKSRCPELAGKVIAKPGAEVAGVLSRWLHGAPAERQEPMRGQTASNQQPAQHQRDAAPLATDAQWVSIRKLADALNRPYPPDDLTFEEARQTIITLSERYRTEKGLGTPAAEQATKATQQTAQAPAGAMVEMDAQVAKAAMQINLIGQWERAGFTPKVVLEALASEVSAERATALTYPAIKRGESDITVGEVRAMLRALEARKQQRGA